MSKETNFLNHRVICKRIARFRWLHNHTKNGTILILHDYGWAEGVIKAVDEIVKPIEIKRGKSVENMYITQINAGHLND